MSVKSSKFNISRWALEHAALTRYLLVVLMFLGVAAYFQLGQDEDPPFQFRAMVIKAYWPGATAEQMADQVSSKIERTLQEVPYADKMRTYTKSGESTTIFMIKDSSPPHEVQGVWYQVRKKIGDMRYTLPSGVQGPFFNDEFGDVYGSIFALSGEGFSYEELRQQSEAIRGQLLRVQDVAKVELFGVQDEQLQVEVSQKRLAQYGLDLNSVLAQLSTQNAIESAGVVRTATEEFPLRVSGQLQTVEALRELPLRGVNPVSGQGSQIKLGDVATITRGYVDPAAVKVRHQGREVIAMGVSMAKGGDIIRLGERLQGAMKEARGKLPAGMTLEQVQNQPESVSRSVGEFVHVLIEAVVIVLAVSFVSLGLHTRPLRIDIWPGMVVAITIPLVLAITFVVMYYWGVGLHKISLGALIIALGLLVDDAIIAVEMMVRKLE
ncbi:MAG: efflux RND transporter permease subunit, partial [Burkholderiaceae bacterium]